MEEIDFHREELRGLFTLGLLAVLVSLRLIVEPTTTTEVLGVSFEIIPFIDVTLLFMGQYAFFMVLAFSDDIPIIRRFTGLWYFMARSFLAIYFFLLILIAILLLLNVIFVQISSWM